MENTILLSGEGTKLKYDLDDSLHGDYQVALQSLSTYYSWPNINASNNQLIYLIEGEGNKIITIPEGCYDLKDIAIVIKSNLKSQGYENAFRLGGNVNTLKSVIDVMSDKCIVNIGQSSIKIVLGWETGNLVKGVHTSPKKVNITDVVEILVHCDIIQGIYTPDNSKKLSRQTVLTSFSPDVAPGYKIIKEPQRLFYSPVHTSLIKEITLWLTDQNYKPIVNNEILTVKLHFKTINNK